MKPRVSHALVVVMLSCTSDTAPTPEVDSMRHVELQLLDSWPVDDPANVASGAVLDDSTVYLWLRSGEVLERRSSLDSTRHVASEGHVIPLAAYGEGGGPVLASPITGVVRAVSGPLLSDGTWSCDPLVGTVSTVAAPAGLASVARDSSGGYRVSLLSLDQRNCQSLGTTVLHCELGPPTVVPSADGEMLAGCPDPTVPLLRLRLVDDTLSISAVDGSLADGLDASPDHRWFGLPLIRLDSAILRVVTDLRSDRRLFALWSLDGWHIRSIALDQPLGLVASSPSGRLVLGMMEGHVAVFEASWVTVQ